MRRESGPGEAFQSPATTKGSRVASDSGSSAIDWTLLAMSSMNAARTV